MQQPVFVLCITLCMSQFADLCFFGYIYDMNQFDSSMLCVLQVTEEIWVCEKHTITKWEGDIFSYKHQLSNQTRKERAKSIKP